ncbi:hypothetical protein [Serratia odorifera]|uniref:OstA-like protein n=2 Tax=Serratia odorifera TaxID=618 RepID=D4E9Y2_SEROD|nr:hypothetical protein [Serratia odorifera]EFE93374.1 hypothetical protein HMPREF0758_4982 [Serratia odorifera DSM 4582]
MKKTLTISVVSATLFFIVPAHAMEVSADTNRPVQEYDGHARIMFKPGEKFTVSSERISKEKDATLFTGNVVVAFEQTTLKMDSVSERKQSDGSSLLEATRFLLAPADGK